MKHLLSAADLSYDDALQILDTAKQLAAATEQGVGKLPHYAVVLLLTCFTKIQLELAFPSRLQQSDLAQM